MCYRRATAAGHDVVFYGDSGDIIQNDEGLPVQKPADLPADFQAAYGERLDDVQGSSVPTAAGALRRSGVLDRGYDFEPGSRELVYEDCSQDRVGDFPRGLEFRRGDISVVAVDGRRVLMVRGDGELDLPLSETLPEQFTLEFEVRATRPLPNG